METGRYRNASEATRAGLRLLDDHETTLNEIRGDLVEGLKQAATGGSFDGPTAINRALDQALAKSGK